MERPLLSVSPVEELPPPKLLPSLLSPTFLSNGQSSFLIHRPLRRLTLVARPHDSLPSQRPFTDSNSSRRPGSALEAAKSVLFLVSPLASYISGHTLEVTGGRGI